MSWCGSFGRKLRAVCLLVIVGAIGGQICSLARGGTIYSTSFDNPPFASNGPWAGVDGWYSNIATSNSQGVLVAGSVYLGYAAPSQSRPWIARDLLFDPVGSKQPIVTIRTKLGIVDSTSGNTHYDAFSFAVFNNARTFICSLTVDNTNGSVYFNNGDGTFKQLPATIVDGYFYEADLTIDFSTGLASATLTAPDNTKVTLFKDWKLSMSESALSLGSVLFEWIPLNSGSPGNNYLVVDELSINAFPAPSLVLSKGTVHHVSGPNFTIRGGQAAEDNVTVEWRTKKHHKWTAVRGSSTSWSVPVKQLEIGRNLVDVRLLNADQAVIDQKRIVIIRK